MGLVAGSPAIALTRRWNMSKVLAGIPKVGIVLAPVFSVMGCLAAMVLVYHGFPDLPGVQGVAIDDRALVQVVMPGEAEVVLPEAGAYGVYYDDLSLGEPECPADFDGDGDVDAADLLHLLGAWGTPNGDVDGDGDTDTADLLALLGAWGACP